MAARQNGSRESEVDEVVIDDAALHEWESLSQLIAELRAVDDEAAGVDVVIPLLHDRDGPMVHRWIVTLQNVRRLSDVTRLRASLRRQPWCLAARVVAVGPDEIRLLLTATVRNSRKDITNSVRHILAGECGSSAGATVTRFSETGQP